MFKTSRLFEVNYLYTDSVTFYLLHTFVNIFVLVIFDVLT